MNQAVPHDDQPPQDGPEKYISLIENTELGEQLSTPAGRRAALYDMLARHSDPMWREMGEQLKNGQLRPIDIFAVPAYREHLLKGFEQAKERHEEIFDAVERAATGGENPHNPSPSGATGTRPPARRGTVPDEDELDEVPINWERR